ncbi:MAG: hypothetical protein JST08_01380 [Actinobacteria bacterium]|nr:hypothetical protein [Actinomycetota bacterium]
MSASRPLLVPALLLLLATVALARCGGGSSQGDAARQGAARRDGQESRVAAFERVSAQERRAAYLDRVRDAIVHGAAVDFAIGTGIGGPPFEACVRGLLRKALDGPTIADLTAIYHRPYGAAFAAQALNEVTAPLAGRCGHRYWVPELVEAARGLRSAAPIGAAIEKLGVTYGPYLGMRCRQVGYGRCDRVGIDVVFGRAATGVVAVFGGAQRIRLRTPGRHSAIKYRDWVGTFTRVDLPPRRHHQDQALAHVPIELRVRFADGRRAQALFPRVLVSSGWG